MNPPLLLGMQCDAESMYVFSVLLRKLDFSIPKEGIEGCLTTPRVPNIVIMSNWALVVLYKHSKL